MRYWQIVWWSLVGGFTWWLVLFTTMGALSIALFPDETDLSSVSAGEMVLWAVTFVLGFAFMGLINLWVLSKSKIDQTEFVPVKCTPITMIDEFIDFLTHTFRIQ